MGFHLLIGGSLVRIDAALRQQRRLPPLVIEKVNTGAGIASFFDGGGTTGISLCRSSNVAFSQARRKRHHDPKRRQRRDAILIGEVHRVLSAEGAFGAAHDTLAYKYLGDVA